MPHHLPVAIIFKKPSEMLGAHVQLLYLHIIVLQANGDTSTTDS